MFLLHLVNIVLFLFLSKTNLPPKNVLWKNRDQAPDNEIQVSYLKCLRH